MSPALLDGIDRAIFASAFVDRLRRAGLPVSIHSAERLANAFTAVQPTAKTELYWMCRVCLVQDYRSLDLLDRVVLLRVDVCRTPCELLVLPRRGCGLECESAKGPQVHL